MELKNWTLMVVGALMVAGAPQAARADYPLVGGDPPKPHREHNGGHRNYDIQPERHFERQVNDRARKFDAPQYGDRDEAWWAQAYVSHYGLPTRGAIIEIIGTRSRVEGLQATLANGGLSQAKRMILERELALETSSLDSRLYLAPVGGGWADNVGARPR